MEWLNQFNEAINYIEEHLTDEIDMNNIAQIAKCSSFHFQRMFSYMADLPLSEYIRRRKMTRAAFDLQNTDEKIIDIALKYGYSSPTAFNRAFQGVHGVAPSSAREGNVFLKSYPPISFKITIRGEAEMNYRIEKKESFRVVGVSEHYLFSMEETFQKVPLFWQKVAMEGTIGKLATMMGKPPFGLLGVSACMEGTDFDYYIAVSTDTKDLEGFAEYTIPECTWAIFECIGALPNAMQSLQKRIVTEWLPASGYEYANAPDIEVYLEGNQQADDYRCEVWLPIKKQER